MVEIKFILQKEFYMEQYFVMLFTLMFAHFLGDFAFQNDFVAKAKNPKLSSKEIWPIVMLAHCMIHAGMVLIITRSLMAAMVVLVLHYIVDYYKCMGLFGTRYAFAIDQGLHIGLIAVIAGIV